MELGVYSATDSVSFANFITSNVFEKNSFKLVVSKACMEDIITAHKDVYCGEEEEAVFEIACREIVYDKALFESYLQKVDKNEFSLPRGFMGEDKRKVVQNIIKTVNALFSLVRNDTEVVGKNVRADELVVTEDVASFDFEDVTACDENFYNYPICTGDEENGGPQFVPLTRVLELRHEHESKASPNLFRDVALTQPFYNEFIVFNKGYGYIADIFREVFPEFQVIVHSRFPKLDLAEQMLWYQANKLVCNDRRQVASVVIEKIRTFFDCCEKKKKSDHTMAISEEIPYTDEEPYHVWPDTRGYVIPDLRGYVIPEQPTITNNGLLPQFTMQQLQEQQTFVEYQSRMMPPKNGTRDAPLTQTEFAQAFSVEASPVKDAFDPTGWGKDTRKEAIDMSQHVQKRMMIKEFVDSQCHRIPGRKIKSSKLFETFRSYYNSKNLHVEFEKAFNQTSFSTIMKQVSTFDTERKKDGMYWINLHVGDVSPELQEEMRRLALTMPFNQQTKKVQPLLLDTGD